MTGQAFYSWWGGLEHSIRSGESSVPGIEGLSSFEYLHRHPEQTRRFNRMMSEMIGAMATGVLAAYDFGAFGTVVDVGGGRGTLLSAILESYSQLRGVLFDLPATAQEGAARRSPPGSRGPVRMRRRRLLCGVPRALHHSFGGHQRLERREERGNPQELPPSTRARGKAAAARAIARARGACASIGAHGPPDAR